MASDIFYQLAFLSIQPNKEKNVESLAPPLSMGLNDEHF